MPHAPASLRLQGGDREIAVVWRAPRAIRRSDLLGFRIQRRVLRASGAGRWRTRAAGPGVRRLLLSRLVDGTSVEVRVAARSRFGTSRPAIAVGVVGASARTSGGPFTAVPTALLLGATSNATGGREAIRGAPLTARHHVQLRVSGRG